MQILIINQYTTNKGDRAILYFILRELVRIGIRTVTVSASQPQRCDSSWLPNGISVRFVPWGWNINISEKKRKKLRFKIIHRLNFWYHRSLAFCLIRKSIIKGKYRLPIRFLCNRHFWRAAKEADVVISTGGHHLTSLNASNAECPQTYDMALVSLLKKRFLLWSQSIGPILCRNESTKDMIRKIIASTERIYIRDEQSMAELVSLGANLENVVQVPESVFGLYDIPASYTKPSQREKILGISVYTTKMRSKDEYIQYIKSMSSIVNQAVEAGYSVHFFSMDIEEHGINCITDIVRFSKQGQHCKIVDADISVEEHINRISKCRLFIGHKTHSIVFALTTATPLIAIAYHRKTEDFMSQYTLSDYCIKDEEVTPQQLKSLFEAVDKNMDSISLQEKKVSIKLGCRVQEDFSKMINAIISQLEDRG